MNKVLEVPFAMKELTEAGEFSGHCAVFGNIDLQGDRIRKGAFAETIEESGGRWPVLFSHDTGRCCGFSKTAHEDSRGLYVEGEFTLTSDEGKNAHALCKHAQALKQPFGLSIGYQIRGKEGADYNAETNTRILKNLTVLEFSVTPVPANLRARLAAVKEISECRTLREVETWLRDHGATGDEARIMISICRKERDANTGSDLERDAKDLDCGAAFMAELRDQQLIFQMKGI